MLRTTLRNGFLVQISTRVARLLLQHPELINVTPQSSNWLFIYTLDLSSAWPAKPRGYAFGK